MSRALAAMGINYENDGENRKYPYEVWCEKERKYLEKLTREMYEEYCKANPDFYKENGPIHFYHPVADKSKKGGVDKETFAAKRIIEEEKADIIAAQKKNAEKEAYLDEREDCLDQREDSLDERKNSLDKREADIEFSLQSKKIGLDARAEMNKQDAEKNKADAEKNRRNAAINERDAKNNEAYRASLDTVVKETRQEFEQQNEIILIQRKQELDDEYAQKEKFMRNKFNSAISEVNHLISQIKDDTERERYSSISRRINTSLSEANIQAAWINRKHERDNEKIS